MSASAQTVVLIAGQWVRLPGTGVSVFLEDKIPRRLAYRTDPVPASQGPDATAAWAADARISASEFMALSADKRRALLDQFLTRFYEEQLCAGTATWPASWRPGPRWS